MIINLMVYSCLNSSCLTNSCTGTSRALAIAISTSRLGWVVLGTHLETVAGSLPNLSDNHLLFRSRSASTTLILFNYAMIESLCLVQKYYKYMKQMQYCSKICRYKAKYCRKRQSFDADIPKYTHIRVKQF